MLVINYFIIFIYNLVCMLLVTLIIASLTLIERKVLSLVQRRVGPFFVGYRGRLQYIADALKLLNKGLLIPHGSSKFWFVMIPSFTSGIIYTFWMNSIWGPSISIFEIEYNIVYATILSLLFSYCIILTGYFSRSKYALMASVRSIILSLNLEIFLGLLFINLIFLSESFCISTFVTYQEYYWFFIIFFGILGLIIITFLLETNRAPFDLAEAESELVCGYTTEYGGFSFALYYLGEYFHLFFFSLFTTILFFGGWEFPKFFFFFYFKIFFFI